MPALGNEKYPELDPDEAVEIAGTLVNEFGGEVSSEEAFAQSIGHKTSNSGAYINKVADLRRYGILPSRGIEATDLAHRLANPKSESDEREAKFQMLSYVDLLSNLYDHLNASEPPGEFWRVLTEITDANPKEAKEVESWIQELYERMLALDVTGSEKTSSEFGLKRIRSEETTEDVTGSTDGIYIRVGEDELSLTEISLTHIELAQTFLESKAKSISEGTEAQGTLFSSDTSLTESDDAR